MRLAAYTGVSVSLAIGVALKGMHQRSNYYSASVFLSQSNANLMIIANLCLLTVGYILFGLQRLFYGQLRQIETEQLYEKAWFAVTETCLAMTIFRGEMGAWFLVMFVCLVVGKVWGWIGEGRLEVLEQQPPSNPLLFHSRLTSSLLLLVLFNSYMLKFSVDTVLRQARPDMMVMFGFEFAVLTTLSTSTAARYVISLAEMYIIRKQKAAKLEERRAEVRAERENAIRQESGSEAPLQNLASEEDIDYMELDVPGWEEKGRWIFYLNLLTDFIKLVVYLSFFAILFRFYGLPIHILRDVVLTIRSFAKRILDFLRYRHATMDMNNRYPDATAEEIGREDVCIICREEMLPWQPQTAQAENQETAPPHCPLSERLRSKKLPCGHLLHFACLRSWLERQQNCPTCRQPVTAEGGQASSSHGNNGANGGEGNGVQQGANANDAGGAANGQRPRLWFLNLGFLRIGFGAGRADLLQNLNPAQVPAQGQDQPEPRRPRQRANANAQAARQPRFGFGFGIERPGGVQPGAPTPAVPPGDAHLNIPLAPTTTEFNHNNVQIHIRELEQQINQEINNLRNTADQLELIRRFQAELARLRAAQGGNEAARDSTAPEQISGNQIPIPDINLPDRQLFGPNFQVTPIAAGDSRLPRGVALPEGWSLVPLRRIPTSQSANSTSLATVAAINGQPPSRTMPPNFHPPPVLPHTRSPQYTSANIDFTPQEFGGSDVEDATSGLPGNSHSRNMSPSSLPGLLSHPVRVDMRSFYSPRHPANQAGIFAASPSDTSSESSKTASPSVETEDNDHADSINGELKAASDPEESNSNDRRLNGRNVSEVLSESRRSSDKGKGRAATVEDSNDDWR